MTSEGRVSDCLCAGPSGKAWCSASDSRQKAVRFIGGSGGGAPRKTWKRSVPGERLAHRTLIPRDAGRLQLKKTPAMRPRDRGAVRHTRTNACIILRRAACCMLENVGMVLGAFAELIGQPEGRRGNVDPRLEGVARALLRMTLQPQVVDEAPSVQASGEGFWGAPAACNGVNCNAMRVLDGLRRQEDSFAQRVRAARPPQDRNSPSTVERRRWRRCAPWLGRGRRRLKLTAARQDVRNRPARHSAACHLLLLLQHLALLLDGQSMRFRWPLQAWHRYVCLGPLARPLSCNANGQRHCTRWLTTCTKVNENMHKPPTISMSGWPPDSSPRGEPT